MIAIRLTGERLEKVQAAAKASGRADEVAMVGGRAVVNLVKNWLFGLDVRANRLGGARTHFYSAAAKSVTNPQVSGNGVEFSITKLGFAQRWLGGLIKAGQGTSSATGGPTKYLAIPARAEAYGRTPGEFNDLQFVPRGNGRGMLVQAYQSLIGIGKKGIERLGEVGSLVMFWLVPEVWQKPDPTVMPSESRMVYEAAGAMEQYLARRLA